MNKNSKPDAVIQALNHVAAKDEEFIEVLLCDLQSTRNLLATLRHLLENKPIGTIDRVEWIAAIDHVMLFTFDPLAHSDDPDALPPSMAET